MPNRLRSRWRNASRRPPRRRLLNIAKPVRKDAVRDDAVREDAARDVAVREDAACDSGRRLEAALELNHLIADAAAGLIDERGLWERALAAIGRLVGALGCSFVPVDAWQQPLPPFTHGDLPAPVLSAWSTRLASGQLSERCGACQASANPKEHSTMGACPLHPVEVGEALRVFCMPLIAGRAVDHSVSDRRTGTPVGVLHLYLPAGKALGAEARAFINQVLPDIAQAYGAARLRSQEAATMRQLKLLNDPESDFQATLNGLLDGLRGALDADFAVLRAGPGAGERIPELNLRRGSSLLLCEGDLQALVEEALQTALREGAAFSPPGVLPAWYAVRLPEPMEVETPIPAADRTLQRTQQRTHPRDMLRDGRGSNGSGANGRPGANTPAHAGHGILLVGSDRPRVYHPRQQVIVQAVAAQAALLVGFEGRFRSLEYSVVIQERARLAREIHDGLAQTLAFLKLQAAQMQSQLAQGELDRLAQVLKDSYQVLSEAYLDTRQAIDNLRLTPQDGLERWIERVVSEFERGAGLKVERSVQPLERPVAPEVQVQLIRIVQEALNNVRKHAHARRVRVCLREAQGGLFLEVSDDGQGFDPADVPDVSRHGLRGMRERAEMIGAQFTVISAPLQGTTMRLTLPGEATASAWSAERQAA